MNFKKVLISELKPAAYNPRKNLTDKDPEYQRIKKSIETFGYCDPVIVNSDYTVIGGHQRLKVLKEMGEASIDVVVLDIPKTQEKALNVALNKITGEWDFSQLSIVLSELKEEDFDISITGFSDEELKKIDEDLFGKPVALDTEPQISRAEELRKEWKTELGQLWQCGEHRVICGDCTDPAVVQRVMGGEKADITFTSPPYNMGKNATLHGNPQLPDNKYENYTDDNPDYLELISGFTTAALSQSKYVFVDIQQLAGNKIQYIDFLNNFKNNYVDEIIWVKDTASPAMAEQVLNSYFEHILIFTDKEKPSRRIDTVKFRGTISNVYNGAPQRKNEFSGVHAATFPMHLPTFIINSFTPSSGSVLDPFLGSGTTMIACENLGRKCRGIEIDPGYLGVILERYKTTFNKQPILLESD